MLTTSAASRPRVYVRIRPLNERERVEGKGELACRRDTAQGGVLYVRKDDKSNDELQARFDHVFDSDDGQQAVYEHIAPEVQRALFSGYNASIFAYGQTGSGKTYTMEGVLGGGSSNNNKNDGEGLVPRLLRGIFATFTRDATLTNATVHMSLVQIYQERIQDLLNSCKQLELHMDHTGQYVARDATWCRVDGVAACMRRYSEAATLRATSATELNLVSSRSHMILMLRLQWDAPALPGSRAQLNLVDLAGSERLADSGAVGDVMNEAIHINKSLSALGNVVMRLVEQAKRPHRRLHVPYKDSKLTYLLQSSLGGSNLMHFILAVSGSALWRSETASTIAFGKRALQLVLRPVRNAIDYTRLAEMEAMIERMRSHIATLEEELRDARHGGSAVTTAAAAAALALASSSAAAQDASMMAAAGAAGAINGDGGDHAAFLRLRRLTQHDDEDDDEAAADNKQKRRRRRRRGDADGSKHTTQDDDTDDDGDDEDDRNHRRHRPRGSRARQLKRQTELTRIMANLPETFDELMSHCVLFPTSRQTFRELGGLQRLVHYVQRAASPYYRAHAAQALASVLDDGGRVCLVECGGIDALARLLRVDDERCKEAACVALEAACRGCERNKAALTADVYATLASLVDGYSNQQVQEAACAAVATLVDGYAVATRALEAHDIVARLLRALRACPAEVVHVVKAATNCLGRLAHGDAAMQTRVGDCGGVVTLIDDVLFSPAGARDHQLPILASYALVNVCCSHARNLATARAHPRYGEVKFRLLEGLARAFGGNAVRAGYAHAVAHDERDAHCTFTYHGVTVRNAWTRATAGGRPVLASFVDNPQLHLRVGVRSGNEDNKSSNSSNNNTDAAPVDVAFVIQDTEYEARLRRKRRGQAVFMGIAIFDGDAATAAAGLKHLDFHGRMVDMSSYTSNCENVLHCTLPPRAAGAAPYVVVPFTSQRGRCTSFVLSAFADAPVELTAVRDDDGWLQTTLRGRWGAWSGRGGGDGGGEWRCNPQLRVRARDDCRIVFVLSYDDDDGDDNNDNDDDDDDDDDASSSGNVVARRRGKHAHNKHNSGSGSNISAMRVRAGGSDGDEDSDDAAATAGGAKRPRLHGRLFRSSFAPDKRYVRALVPLPQHSPFVASNAFASSSYVTTSATLQRGGDYVYIPFTEQPCEAGYTVTVYCDSEDVDVRPLSSPSQDEWCTSALRAAWHGQPLTLGATLRGRAVLVAHSAQTFVRVRVCDARAPRHVLAEMTSFWHSEAVVEIDCRHTNNNNKDGNSSTSKKKATQKSHDGGSSGEDEEVPVIVYIEGVVRTNKTTTSSSSSSTADAGGSAAAAAARGQEPAHAGVCDVLLFSEYAASALHTIDADVLPCPLRYPSTTTPPSLLQYAQCVTDDEDSGSNGDVIVDDNDSARCASSSSSSSASLSASLSSPVRQEGVARTTHTRSAMRRVAAENAQLRHTLAQQADELAQLRREVTHNNNSNNKSSSSSSPTTTTQPHVAVSARSSDHASVVTTASSASTTAAAGAATTTAAKAAAAAAAREANELRASIEYALLRLHGMLQQGDGAHDALRMRRDAQALQHYLFSTLERCDKATTAATTTTTTTTATTTTAPTTTAAVATRQAGRRKRGNSTASAAR